MSRLRPLLPSIGAAAMLVSTALPAQATVLHIKMCGGGTVDIPIGHGGKTPRGRDCPAACHAPTCQQRKRAGVPSV